MTAAVAILLAACSAKPPAGETSATTPAPGRGDPSIASRGRSCDSAVAIEATTESDGVARENVWIDENYPGAKTVTRSQTQCNDKPADAVIIVTGNGDNVTLYFDISAWHGK